MTRRIRPALLELARSFGVALVLLLFIGAFIAIPYRVEQRSMEATLLQGDLVLVDKLGPKIGGFHRFELVIFTAPGAWSGELDTPYVKRIVGLPGETVDLVDGRLLVDGNPLDEPYANGETLPTGETERWEIGDNEYFVLGDNRGDSVDSRVFGPVDASSIIGRVALRYAPPSRFSVFLP